MRRPILNLLAVFGCLCPAIGSADEFNPFVEASTPLAAAPLAPEPLPISPPAETPLVPAEEAYEAPPAPPGGHHPLPGEADPQEHHGHQAPPHHGHQAHQSHGHHEHGHQAHHAHQAHAQHGHGHEEELGNIRVTPLYREIESDIWDAVFDSMYSVNVGTTFWHREHQHHGFSTQLGLVTEFQYSHLNARDDTNINSVVSIPFAIRENLRVDDADIYAGNIGPSFAISTLLPDSCTKLELGVSPLLMIGNLNADLVPNTPAAGGRQIILDRGASDNGTIVGGDFRVWTGIKTAGGFRAGLTGFYSVAETDAIFDSSETFNTYGGGVYVEMPTHFVPHEFPAPMGTFQWIEEILHLE